MVVLMSIQSKKICLRITTFFLLSLAAAQVWHTLRIDAANHPIAEVAETTASHQVRSTPAPAADGSTLQFDEEATIRLQRPLFDPPPPAPKVEVKPPPPPIHAKLLGTVINPTRPQAIIRDEQGRFTFRSIGEAVSDEHPDAIIEEIFDSSVRLKRGEATETMVIE